MTPEMKDIISFMIQAHAGQVAKNIETNALLQRLLDNMPPPTPRTPLERLQDRISEMRQRVLDAIKVLRGEAEIYEGWDD